MKLHVHGTNTSEIEVANIDSHGFWIYIKGKEYFLPYEEYPWFKDANISEIINVELLHEYHLYWPKLDVDLDVGSLKDPDQTPLIYK